MLTGRYKLVLEADIEGCVGMGGKRHPCLPDDILRSTVFIAHCIFDLAEGQPHTNIDRVTTRDRTELTYMHIDNLSIALGPINNGRHKHERILSNEVPDAPFVFLVVSGVGGEVELEGPGEWRGRQKDQNSIEYVL